MNKTKPIFTSIDGHGGSGKSTFANLLATAINAEIVRIDDFTGDGASTDWYKTLKNKVIEPALSGAKLLHYSRAKWWPEHTPEPVVNQPVTPIIIIEGVCSSRKELREFLSFKIFIDTPRNVCIQRGLARDKNMGGKNDEEILAIWNQWLKWDDEYFAKDNPKSIADFIVDGTKSFDDDVKAIIQKLEVIQNSNRVK